MLTYLSHADEANAVVAQIESLGSRAVALQLDTGNTSKFSSFTERYADTLQRVYGRHSFDYLVNNAGIGINASFAETTEDEFDMLMNIYLKGVFFLTQRLLPLLEDGGRIVNLSSPLVLLDSRCPDTPPMER